MDLAIKEIQSRLECFDYWHRDCSPYFKEPKEKFEKRRQELKDTRDQLKSVLDILSSVPQANELLPLVSGSLPDDVPLFVDWLDKYYTHAGNDDLYKRKDNGTIEPQRKLYKDYCRAYKLKQ